MIACPDCGAPAGGREKQATPCRTWEAINSGGKVCVTEAHEVRDPDGVVQRTRIMLSQEGRELLDDAASGGGNAGARLADR